MRLVERDIKLFKWINSHGYVTADQICSYLKVKSSAGYARINKLVAGGYITRKRILHGHPRIHQITKLAKLAASDELPLLNKISLGEYNHTLELINVSLKLQEKHPTAEYIAERTYRHITGLSAVGRSGHIPDGVLEFKNGKKHAIELEMSVKASSRLDKIMKFYASNFDFNKVVYFVTGQSIVNAIQNAADRIGIDHIEINLLKGEDIKYG